MTDCALAIFVKTPGHSPIKTRLAASRGRTFAEQFHGRAAACVAESTQFAADALAISGSTLRTYWAVAEAEALQSPRWAGLPKLSQGSGALGQRMAHVHAQLLTVAGSALLVGADSPQITPALIAESCAWLVDPQPRCVIGPALDGGFWLFGSNVAFPQSAWRSVIYSRADTAARFIAALEATVLARWKRLATRVDVDTDRDLAPLCRELGELDNPLPQQARLMQWLLDADLSHR